MSSKSKGRSPFSGYNDIRTKVEGVAVAKRREYAIGRNGAKVAGRQYGLDADDITRLTALHEAGQFPNPFNKGNYHYIVAALVDLGINQKHSRNQVFQRVRKLMSDESTKNASGQTAWERFDGREPRAATGLDTEGRFWQNVNTLQRVGGETSFSPYGLKLLEACQKILGKTGGVIDILVADTGTEYLRLNTNATVPTNEMKVRGVGSKAAKAAERAAKRAAKTETPELVTA